MKQFIFPLAMSIILFAGCNSSDGHQCIAGEYTEGVIPMEATAALTQIQLLGDTPATNAYNEIAD